MRAGAICRRKGGSGVSGALLSFSSPAGWGGLIQCVFPKYLSENQSGMKRGERTKMPSEFRPVNQQLLQSQSTNLHKTRGCFPDGFTACPGWSVPCRRFTLPQASVSSGGVTQTAPWGLVAPRRMRQVSVLPTILAAAWAIGMDHHHRDRRRKEHWRLGVKIPGLSLHMHFMCVWQPHDIECCWVKERFGVATAVTQAVVVSPHRSSPPLPPRCPYFSFGPCKRGSPAKFPLALVGLICKISFSILCCLSRGLCLAAVIAVLWQGPTGTANWYYLRPSSDLQSRSAEELGTVRSASTSECQ